MSRRAFERWDWACYIATGRITTAQRAVLLVVARHAGESSTGSRISQATIADSAGITDRGVRKALTRLEALGLIVGEPQPGKPTIWTLNLDWTPEPRFQGDLPQPRNPRSRVAASDPGTTPERPRNPRSYEGEGEGEGTTSLTSYVAKGRGEEEGEVIQFNPRTLPRPGSQAVAAR